MNSASFSTVNRANGEQVETFPFSPSRKQKPRSLALKRASSRIETCPLHQRAELLSKLAATLRKNKAQLAKVITTEMGKILSEAEGEVEKCAWEADWYAEHGPQMLTPY